MTPDSSNNKGTKNEMEGVRRANRIPYWLAMHHWPDASPVTAGHGPMTQARIGVFDHACETAGAFNVHTGFQRRARCFKCASIYLYNQDLDSIRAEADMNGPHRTEITYDWVADKSGEGNDGSSSGPTCAEALGHLLCSEIM